VVGTGGADKRQIAVLADHGLVGALRLAGVRLARVMEADAAAAPRVRELLREWMADEAIGVIIIAEDLAALAKGLLDSWRAEKRLFPVILQVPASASARCADVAGYYRKLSRDVLGLEIVLEEFEAPPARRNAGAA
jgi:vacuolar-type H+-ATPase subunit F/Vma7